jgi:hypothetical protein
MLFTCHSPSDTSCSAFSYSHVVGMLSCTSHSHTLSCSAFSFSHVVGMLSCTSHSHTLSCSAFSCSHVVGMLSCTSHSHSLSCSTFSCSHVVGMLSCTSHSHTLSDSAFSCSHVVGMLSCTSHSHTLSCSAFSCFAHTVTSEVVIPCSIGWPLSYMRNLLCARAKLTAAHTRSPAYTYTHTRAHTHTHTRAHAHTHTHYLCRTTRCLVSTIELSLDRSLHPHSPLCEVQSPELWCAPLLLMVETKAVLQSTLRMSCQRCSINALSSLTQHAHFTHTALSRVIASSPHRKVSLLRSSYPSRGVVDSLCSVCNCACVRHSRDLRLSLGVIESKIRLLSIGRPEFRLYHSMNPKQSLKSLHSHLASIVSARKWRHKCFLFSSASCSHAYHCTLHTAVLLTPSMRTISSCCSLPTLRAVVRRCR